MPPLVCVVGDATLDVMVQPAGPMVPGGDRRAAITLGVGGQGANVAVRLARRGARVRLVTMLADDPAGHVIQATIQDEGVEVTGLEAERSAVVVALVEEDGERSMLSDRVPFSGVFGGLLDGADWLHLSGYLLRDPVEAAHLVGQVQPAAIAHLSVAGGSFEDPVQAATARAALASLPADLLILSRSEAETLGTAGARLAGITVVTNGELGSTATGGAAMEDVHVPAALLPEVVVDATGAGDAYAAALIGGLSGSWPPSPDQLRAAMDDASLAGARAARVLGAQGPIADERLAAAR